MRKRNTMVPWWGEEGYRLRSGWMIHFGPLLGVEPTQKAAQEQQKPARPRAQKTGGNRNAKA